MEIRMVNGKPKEFSFVTVPPMNPADVMTRDGVDVDTIGRQGMIPIPPPEQSVLPGYLENVSYGRTAPKYGVHA